MAQAPLWLTVPCYLRIHEFVQTGPKRGHASPNPPPTDVRSTTVMVLTLSIAERLPATTFGAHSLKCVPFQNARHCFGRRLASTTWNKAPPNRKPHAVGFPCYLRSFPAVARGPLWFRKEMDQARLRASCECRDNPCRAHASLRPATSWLHHECSLRYHPSCFRLALPEQ
ncbi:hypothetical protein EDB89DRAFT_233344 [Lactarius sanguifluus]|nr:hypothetical protein EDB89DRAFT_233344 [Lactarius sanguifluus]